MKSALPIKKGYGLLWLMVLLLVACKVTLLSSYDEVTDKVLSQMQQKTTAFFVKSEFNPNAEELKYKNQQQFYIDLKTDATTLRIRNNAVEKNKPMIGMLDLLDENINLMDSLHRNKPNGLLSVNDVRLLKSAFETQYTAMFKFVMALKTRAGLK